MNEVMFVNLRCGRPGISPADAERFNRAAEQLDVAEGFATVFRTNPEFGAPSRIVAELVATCPDLFA